MSTKSSTPRVEDCQSTLIVGLGRTGLSCARYLHARGISFTVVDSRKIPPGLDELNATCPDAHVLTGEFFEAPFLAAQCLIVSPGVSLEEAPLRDAIAAGKVVLGDIEMFAGVASAPVVAITGSNGKSTVTTLVGQMAEREGLNVRVGGNLGPPALDLIEASEPDLYVLELSSFQLETTNTLRPAAASVLNISPDHMDRYPDLQAYAQAKARVYRGAGVAVVNKDDALSRALLDDAEPRVQFTLSAPADDEFGIVATDEQDFVAFGDQILLSTDEIALAGKHNVANALAALALGHALGFEWQPMLDTLRTFSGLAHRCEFVRLHNGVRWYNDSKATNVGATVAAIHGMSASGPLVLIAGGDAKSADFSALGAAAAQALSAVILIGRDADAIEAAIPSGQSCHRASDMRDAVSLAASLTRDGDIVLMSPACASFDMYDNYEQRGHDFMRLVRELA